MCLTKQCQKLSQLPLLAEFVFNIRRFKDNAGFIFQTVPGQFHTDLFLLLVAASKQEDWKTNLQGFSVLEATIRVVLLKAQYRLQYVPSASMFNNSAFNLHSECTVFV
jgi:hypothetical protein